MKIENEGQLIKKYNNLGEKVLATQDMPACELLNSLTEDELFVFFAGKTFAFGRPFEKCLENASYLMKDREAAIKRFSTADIKKL